ncbi:N(2)-fixation sustaining protein CowN [Niveibacterium sp. 24ML]|uniref:N(2)-fixation sustaining protein CowN n=1 Tax=Niveibacterium sp. 24ML TaxID=2985512 RepID=UPI00226ED9AC|nr:N(2)-fixation sustaining protein CowN [Niveibacterium sp. 24ML]MCX9154673.1 N(2)-fixation sustaining protein CowN [Niveibacterium sp. 24ML]
MTIEHAAAPQAAPDTHERDRYASFVGLDCNGQAQRLVAMLRPYIEDPAKTNGFWQLFARKLNPTSGPRHDELFLIHAHINILRDQLELHRDQAALALLEQIEIECC